MKLTFQAQLAKVESRADRGTKVTFITGELREDAGKLMALAQEEVSVALSDTGSPPLPLPVEPGAQSPSKRLRTVIYKRWERLGSNGDFDEYYNAIMETIIAQMSN